MVDLKKILDAMPPLIKSSNEIFYEIEGEMMVIYRKDNTPIMAMPVEDFDAFLAWWEIQPKKKQLEMEDMKIDAKELLAKLRENIELDDEFVRGLEVASRIVQEMQVDAYIKYLDEHH